MRREYKVTGSKIDYNTPIINEKWGIMASRFERIFRGRPTMIVIHICGG